MKLNSAFGALALLVTIGGSFALSSEASAQGRRRAPIVKARPSAVRTNSQVRTLIDRTERESNALRNSFERDYNRYNLNRLPAGERAKENVQQLDQAFERLRDVADDKNVAKGRNEMQRVVREAQDVDRIFTNHREISSVVRGQWNNLRGDINQLARIYGIGGLGNQNVRRR